jgi:lipopolysaccharide transport system ATP-binding protein
MASSDVVLRAEGLGKHYVIGERERYRTLRETIMKAFRRRDQSDQADDDRHLWALREVGFEIDHGEVVGVIGRNGAGKSTLLKVLSRVTEPTEGRLTVRGRVGSLLEVGTAFHLELTGRENVYLNGSILGMRRREIEQKFDEIVEFAEIERFIDTPVKRFSTGMYLRLAFSVAAHLEPDILLVDEVLAVGDAAFQRKCLGKMDEVGRGGRTVLFVSHNMAAIRSLCDRGLVLEAGRLAFDGAIAEAITHYLESMENEETAPRHGRALDIRRLELRGSPTIAPGDPFEVAFELHIGRALTAFRMICTIYDAEGQVVVHAPVDNRQLGMDGSVGTREVRIAVPPLWLKPGVYQLQVKLLPQTLAASKARVASEPLTIDVNGEVDPGLLLGQLAPDVRWTLADSPATAKSRTRLRARS